MTEKTKPMENSTMASRRAEREAQEAAGVKRPERAPRQTFRVDVDATAPGLVVTRVRA